MSTKPVKPMLLPMLPAGPRTAENLKQHLLDLADVVAKEAGLNDAGWVLTLALQARAQGRPWRGIKYSFVESAASLRDLAQRPNVLASPTKE